jgi:hypothetical protein
MVWVERECSLEFVHGGIVLALENQDPSKLGMSLRQARIEAHGSLRQFKGAIERSRTHIIAIERFGICLHLNLAEQRSGARISRVDREGLFEQTPCVIERCFGASVIKYRPPDLIDFAMTPNRRLSAVRCQET